jgi:hypothetical protein
MRELMRSIRLNNNGRCPGRRYESAIAVQIILVTDEPLYGIWTRGINLTRDQ